MTYDTMLTRNGRSCTAECRNHVRLDARKDEAATYQDQNTRAFIQVPTCRVLQAIDAGLLCFYRVNG